MSNVVKLNENPAAQEVLQELNRESGKIRDVVVVVFYDDGSDPMLMHSACDFTQLSVAAHSIQRQLFKELD